MEIFEDTMVSEVRKYETEMIKYNLTYSEVIDENEVDEHVGNGAATDEDGNNIDGVHQIEVSTEQEVDAGLDFDALTYHLRLRRSKRRTAGQVLHRFGHDTAFVSIGGKDSLPKS